MGLALREEMASSTDLAGFGNSLFRIRRPDTGEIVAFIGELEGKECVHLTRAQPVHIIIALGELLSGRKMRRAMENQDYDKAQRLANKKFEV